MKIGYVRISSSTQNSARQEVLMKELEVEKIYIDVISGKNTDRPELKKMLEFIREGDSLIVESISRFARNTKDLLELVELLDKKEVRFISQKEAIDTSTPTGKFMLTIFGAVSELERTYLLQRQSEGILIAKREGKYTGRQPIAIDDNKFKRLYGDWKAKKITATYFMEQIGLKSNTFYRRVKAYEATM
jgi:DNA invertase Pin-like site-specific DNA recombinase